MSCLMRVALVTTVLGTTSGCPLPGTSDAMPDASTCSAPTTSAVPASLGDPTCPDFGCGTNSATVGDGVVFDELDASGREPTTRGVRINPGATLGDRTPVTLDVDRHFLAAIDGMGRRYEGTRLIGTRFTLTGITSAGTPRSYELTIEKFFDSSNDPELHFWAGDNGESVPFYLITSRPLDSNKYPVPICQGSSELVWGPVNHYAIVFKGDRYDAINKKVTDATVTDTGEPTPWFNLACAGAAPAKMHLLRHTNAAARISPGDSIYQTTISERTAMLKMLTADYCGTGRSYTVDGLPLTYGDSRHWYPATPAITGDALPPPVCSIEALWSENGAVCLDTPRRVSLGDIACPGRTIPPCGGPAGVSGWESGTWHEIPGVHVISANQ